MVVDKDRRNSEERTPVRCEGYAAPTPLSPLDKLTRTSRRALAPLVAEVDRILEMTATVDRHVGPTTTRRRTTSRRVRDPRIADVHRPREALRREGLLRDRGGEGRARRTVVRASVREEAGRARRPEPEHRLEPRRTAGRPPASCDVGRGRRRARRYLGSGTSDPRPHPAVWAASLIARAIASLRGGLSRPIIGCDSGFFAKASLFRTGNGADFAIVGSTTPPPGGRAGRSTRAPGSPPGA